MEELMSGVYKFGYCIRGRMFMLRQYDDESLGNPVQLEGLGPPWRPIWESKPGRASLEAHLLVRFKQAHSNLQELWSS